MIATRFRSVGWVAGVAVAALGCYLVSQRVASERAELASVERQILSARRDIRHLQTEIGTRARMGELERWNGEVLALSAPRASQFVESEVQLASLHEPKPLPLDPAIVESHGAVDLVSAEKPKAVPAAPAAEPQQPLLRQATYIKPKGAAMPEATRVALLSDDLLGDIKRTATTESAAKKKAQ
jgi:hypothetical protein